jgi:hypothetical protein
MMNPPPLGMPYLFRAARAAGVTLEAFSKLSRIERIAWRVHAEGQVIYGTDR